MLNTDKNNTCNINLKILTYIITIGLAAILVIMSISSFKTAVIIYL